jgi:hypothetical protein
MAVHLIANIRIGEQLPAQMEGDAGVSSSAERIRDHRAIGDMRGKYRAPDFLLQLLLGGGRGRRSGWLFRSRGVV